MMPVMIDEEKCNGCGTCVDWCPSDAIAIVDGKARVDAEECIECGACEEGCPNDAISLRNE